MRTYKYMNQKNELCKINNQLRSLTKTLHKIRSGKYTNHSLQLEFNARRKVDNIRSQLQLSKIKWSEHDKHKKD